MLARLFFLFFMLCSSMAVAQLVYTEPFFPRIDDEVTIFFDATEGNAGLANCNCDVYLHTGVITTESSSLTDWRNVQTEWGVANDAWKLDPVPGESNLYSYTISPSIQEYYNLTAGTEVEQIALVFRDATGSREGKDVGNTDIFAPVYPENLPFTTQLLSPATDNFIAFEGENIRVWAVASENSSFSLYDNDALVTQMNGTTLDFDLPAEADGSHEVRLEIDNGEEELQRHSFSYTVPLDLDAADPPAAVEPGLNVLDDSRVILALFAPEKENVFVLGSFNNWQIDTDFQMRPSLNGELWWLEIDGLETGVNYTYQYLVDGTVRIADPFSTLVLDPFNDEFIPEVTFPNLPEYPEDASGIVSVFQLGETPYDWAVDDFEAPAQEDLVVYELLIRDFIERHDYTTLIDTLDYLDRLGVNAIELMPVCEFEGNISWGYNPSYHMALDKYYGPKNEFKRFIDSCHARNIAVIVDAVYNHAFGQSPLVQLYFENGAPAANSPYFNQSPTHPFNVGFDFNHESEATQFFFKKTIQYWIEEFRIDGFRYDLSKGFTQQNNPDNVGAWSAYDASRIALWKEYADFVWSIDSDSYVILEHFADNQEETELIEYGMLVWGNMNFNYNEASMGYVSNSDLNGVLHTTRGWNDKHLIGYMESHDEERLMYKNLEFGNSSGSYSVRNLETALKRQELVSAFFYTLPGPKMLWQFGELGYEVDINFNGRTGPKPIRWGYLEEPDRRRLYDITSALINLRRDYEVFQTEDFEVSIGGTALKTIHLNDDEFDVTVLGNFDVEDRTITPDFQSTGTWYNYFGGDSLQVTDVTAPIELEPGEYRLYTSVRLPEPEIGFIPFTAVAEIVPGAFDLTVAPNPVTIDALQVLYDLPKGGSVRFEIFDQLGRLVHSEKVQQNAGLNQATLRAVLPKGLYTLKMTVGNRAGVVQVMRL